MIRLSRVLRKRIFAIFSVFIAIAIILGPVQSAYATATSFFFPGRGIEASSGGPVIDGGVPDYVNSVSSLVTWLRQTYASGPGGNYNAPYKNQAGIAYFVRLLIGGGADYNISNDDFTKLERLLQPSNGVSINWFSSETGTVDTYSCRHYEPSNPYPDPYDVCAYPHNWSNTSIVIVQNGRLVARIQRPCLNPDGNSPGTLTDANFTLAPTISVSPTFSDGNSGGSDKATLNPIVNNTGITASTAAQWKIVSFKIPSGGSIPTAGLSSSAPEQYYGNGATPIATGSQTFPKNNTTLTVAQQAIGDYPIGTRLCFALSVNPVTASDTRWSHSTPACIVIAKSPKVQVHGGDIRVGSNFDDQSVGSGSNITTSQTVKYR